MTYLVSHQGEQLGPITAAEIVAKISARELDALDYAFDEAKNDWVLLTEVPEVATLLAARKPAAPPKPGQPVKPVVTAADRAHAVTEWFVLKGEAKFGPFPHAEMVSLLQQKIVYPFDFCWHAGMDQWTRVAEVAQFAPGTIRDLMQNDRGVFIKRRFKRVKFEGAVIVHDQRNVWRGRALELSSGGLGVSLNGPQTLVPGQTLTLHCAAHGDLPAFNATCEVVAKTFVSDDSPVEYGLRFLSLSPDAQASINAKAA